VATERVPEIKGNAAMSSTPTATDSEKPVPVARNPHPVEKPVASNGPPGKTAVATVQRGLPGESPSG
jgi:hypothetical protein